MSDLLLPSESLNSPKFSNRKLERARIILAGIILILIILIFGWFGESIFQNFIHQNFPFQASIVENLTSASEKAVLPEIQSAEEVIPVTDEIIEEEEEKSFPQPPVTKEVILTGVQDNIDDIAEKIDVLNQQVADLTKEPQPLVEDVIEAEKEIETEEEPENLEEDVEEKEDIKEDIEEDEEIEEELEEEEVGQEVGQELCERILGMQPLRNKIIISEIAWMGSVFSANDEWIELRNISNSPVDLSGWQIIDKDEQIKIILTGTVLANGFYLLERTNDDSVPGIEADLIYKGVLSNTNEALYLFSPVRNIISNRINENCQLEDEVLANPNWIAGDKSEKRTMESGVGLTWHTFYGSAQNGILGTPKRKNSQPLVRPTGGGGGPPALEPTFCSQDNLSEPSYSPIIFNEIAWMGTSIDWRDEWIELKNISENNVSLDDWQILDKDEEVKVNLTGTVLVNSFYLLERTNDDSVPNISADKVYTGNLEDNDESLRLFDKDCNLIDKIIANPDWLAGNKEERKSMERTASFNWQTYFGEGENGILGTPRKENSQPIELKDETPPVVAFDNLFSLKTIPEFAISWQGEDPIGTASPSGIEAFSLQYIIQDSIIQTATPSNLDVIQYQNEEDNWQNWQENEILEIEESQNQLNLLGEDKEIYQFQIMAQDKAGNESDWEEMTVEINSLPVVINEVAWMGTVESYSNEWIELFNNSNFPINLEGWLLKTVDGTPKIELTGTVPSNGFYLLERTDDNTLPNIQADQIYRGALGNSGEKLELYTLDNYLVDRVVCIEDAEGNCQEWLVGDNDTKQTMERKDPSLSGEDINNWATSQEGGGTPKAQNSQ